MGIRKSFPNLCRHCHTRWALAARGLCYPCYTNRPLRARYATLVRQTRGVWSATKPPPATEPTDAEPGTPEKLAVMAARAASGLSIWHPDDPRLDPPLEGFAGVIPGIFRGTAKLRRSCLPAVRSFC